METTSTQDGEAMKMPKKPVNGVMASIAVLAIVYTVVFVFNRLSMPVLTPTFTFNGRVIDVSNDRVCIQASQPVPPLTAFLFPVGAHDRNNPLPLGTNTANVLCGSIAIATFSPAYHPTYQVGAECVLCSPAQPTLLPSYPVLQGQTVDATITWLPVSGSLIGKPTFLRVHTN